MNTGALLLSEDVRFSNDWGWLELPKPSAAKDSSDAHLEPIIEAVEVITDRMTDLADEQLSFTAQLQDFIKGGPRQHTFWKLSRACQYLPSQVDDELGADTH